MNNNIVFNIETDKVLKILSEEIYDSPYALLRENIQNAYDAIRERFVQNKSLTEGGKINVVIDNNIISISDNGIGMDPVVLRNHFWKAGSSGKHSDRAKEAGVVGTFGIGAMANFGVCSKLTVTTKMEGKKAYKSCALKDSLVVGKECISLDEFDGDIDIGTTVEILLDDAFEITEEQACNYLKEYVRFLPVPLLVNSKNISQEDFFSNPILSGKKLETLFDDVHEEQGIKASFTIMADSNGQVYVLIQSIACDQRPIDGSAILFQSNGQLMCYRSSFGLAPISISGAYSFSGNINLSFLLPTAGRDAINRDSIGATTRIIETAESLVSEVLAKTDYSDKNNSFMHWSVLKSKYELCENIQIRIFPDDISIKLSELQDRASNKNSFYYTGNDRKIVDTFANENTIVFQVSQAPYRRKIHLDFMSKMGVQQLPTSAQIVRCYDNKELTLNETRVLYRITSILLEDYLLDNTKIIIADISHNVNVLSENKEGVLYIFLARKFPAFMTLCEVIENAFDISSPIIREFVRMQIYPKIQQYVPSSTRNGVDALKKILFRNRELYKYYSNDFGLIDEYLKNNPPGQLTMGEIVNMSKANKAIRFHSYDAGQVGSVESVIKGISDIPNDGNEQDSSTVPPFGDDYLNPMPPLKRLEIDTELKVLTTEYDHRYLNGYKMFLGLSDRLMNTEAAFFDVPHSTRIIWAGHRVIYIFTDETGTLNLYYDIELKQPMTYSSGSKGMYPTATLITKKRIFIPVPDELVNEFKIESGYKEFYVKFDVLSNESCNTFS